MESYFIFVGEEKTGPFDLVSMIKKIRSGRLQATDMVMTDAMESPVAANKIKVLHECFVELEYAEPSSLENERGSVDLVDLLQESWSYYEDYQRCSVAVMAALIALLLVSFILNKFLPGIAVALIASTIAGAGIFAFIAFMGSVMRERMDLASFRQAIFSGSGLSLLAVGGGLSSLLIGLPMHSWQWIGPLALIPLAFGFLIFCLFMFAPLIWLEENSPPSLMASLKQSSGWILSQDADTMGKVISLPLINCLALALFVLPLAVSLPVTGHAWVNVYERHFALKST